MQAGPARRSVWPLGRHESRHLAKFAYAAILRPTGPHAPTPSSSPRLASPRLAVYQKERHEFGRPVNTFGFSEVSILEEFVPEPEIRGNHLERNPTILDVQAIPELSENYVNTDTVMHKSQGMNHHEGGWPKEVRGRAPFLPQRAHASPSAAPRPSPLKPQERVCGGRGGGVRCRRPSRPPPSKRILAGAL